MVGQSGGNLKKSCGTEEKALKVGSEDLIILVLPRNSCGTWAVTCPDILHQHPRCVGVWGSCENACMCVNCICFSPFYPALDACHIYMSFLPPVLARGDPEAKGQVLPLREVEGQRQPSACFSARLNPIQAASFCI